MPSYCFFDFLVQIELLLLIASKNVFFDSSVVPSFLLVMEVENESFPCTNKLGERTGKSGETIAVV